MKIVTCGMDLGKTVIQIHGVSEDGQVVISRQLKRKDVLKKFANVSPCLIGMEASNGAHYWARELSRLGHTVKIMAPQYVKPYIKGNKNDANDAEGICEAVSRPNMRFIGVKTQTQQDTMLLHRVREQRVKNRTALVNQIRGLLGEYGITVPVGINQLRTQLTDLLSKEGSPLSSLTKSQFYSLYEDLLLLDDRIAESENEIKAIHKQCKASQRLETIPGIGVITASALVAHIGDISAFKSSRELAAYIGLVPRQNSSGGKTRLLGITKRGSTYLRTLLVHGARTVMRYTKNKKDRDSVWLRELEGRRGKNKACVAQANKTARIVWALLTHGKEYQVAI